MTDKKLLLLLRILLPILTVLAVLSLPYYAVQLIVFNLLLPLWYVIVPLAIYAYTTIIAFFILERGYAVLHLIKKGKLYSEQTLRELGDGFYLTLMYVVVHTISNIVLAFFFIKLPFSLYYLIIDVVGICVLVGIWLTIHFVEQGIEMKKETEGLV